MRECRICKVQDLVEDELFNRTCALSSMKDFYEANGYLNVDKKVGKIMIY